MSSATSTMLDPTPASILKPLPVLPPGAASLVPQALDYRAAAVFLGLQEQNWQVIKRLRESGQLKGKRVGKRWVFLKSELIRFLEK